jgi:hypothetical protein
MSTHATGTFEIEDWDEKPYDEQGGAKLARAHLTKTFHGGVAGECTTDLLLAYAQEASAAYVGLERFVGRVNDLSGSFVLHHSESGERPATHGGRGSTNTTRLRTGSGSRSPRRAQASRPSPVRKPSIWLFATDGSTARRPSSTTTTDCSGSPRASRGASGRRSTAPGRRSAGCVLPR